jgi:hypothetical protein
MIKTLNFHRYIKQQFKPGLFKDTLYKIYLDLDLTFYLVNFDKLPDVIVYEEDDLYNPAIAGIPAFLNFQIPGKEDYNSLIDIDISRLKPGDIYALIKFDHDRFLKTKFVTNLQALTMDRIEFYDHMGELISTFNRKELENRGYV